MLAQCRGIARVAFLLQAYKLDVRKREKLRKVLKRHRAVAIVGMRRAARPGDPDAQAPRGAKALLPSRDPVLGNRDVGDVGRDGGELGTECEWQAEQGAMQIEGRQ